MDSDDGDIFSDDSIRDPTWQEQGEGQETSESENDDMFNDDSMHDPTCQEREERREIPESKNEEHENCDCCFCVKDTVVNKPSTNNKQDGQRKSKSKRVYTAKEVLSLVTESKKKKCLICMKEVCNLNRHLGVHGIRNSYRVVMPSLVNSKAKSKRKLKICHLCQKVMVRVDHHLKQKHKLDGKSYKDSLAKCKIYTHEESSQIQKLQNATGNTPANDLELDQNYMKHQDEFIRYLGRIVGGNLDESKAKKHMDQAWKIVKNVTDINSCITSVGDLISKRRKQGTWSANTCKAYLQSFKKYIDFLQLMAGIGVYKYDLVQLNLLQQQLNKLINAMHRQSVASKIEKEKERDPETVVNPDDVCIYFDGMRAKCAEQILQAATTQSASRYDHTLVRNWLIYKLVVANCHRTGVFINMTIEEFNYAKKRQNGCYIALVKRHKLANRSGPAEVVINQKLQGYINTYITNLRPASDEPEVLVNWSGSPMDCSSVIYALTAELGYLGIQKKFTCTGARHLGASLITAVLPAERKDLASLMLHSERTQQQEYNNCTNSNKNIRIANILEKVISGQTITTQDLERVEFEYPGYDVSKVKLPRTRNDENIVQNIEQNIEYCEEEETENTGNDEIETENTGNDEIETENSGNDEIETENSGNDEIKEKIELSGRGKVMKPWEIDLLIKNFRNIILQKEGVKLHQIQPVYESKKSVRVLADMKWGNRSEKERWVRIRDLLRKFQKDPRKKAMARKMENEC